MISSISFQLSPSAEPRPDILELSLQHPTALTAEELESWLRVAPAQAHLEIYSFIEAHSPPRVIPVGAAVVSMVAQPDCPSQRYAGHSFRRGGATALKLAGVADSDIQRHGRWKSNAYKLYFDADSPAFRLIATRALRPTP